MARRSSRVHDEPAFVVHHYDWSESSLIVDVFTRHHGRLALVAKGAKRPASALRPLLVALLPLRLDWGGGEELPVVKAAHWVGGHVLPQEQALWAGLHLNELVLRLLPRGEAFPMLFDAYAAAVRALAQGAPPAPLLRAFELMLLHAQGWLPDLAIEAATRRPLQAQRPYRLVAEHGLIADARAALLGAQWMALQAALQSPDPWSALHAGAAETLASAALRTQLRALLHYHSGVRAWHAREMMRELRRLWSASHRPDELEP
ncbi:DNA repair protein RecO [Tepidimonas alkaliphilus]|uniref:DNA repair protein RecO n=1 Tax=Tepidimonas alkaliphilus TaxID=2588942 RepID=A0A554W542_9BURK|nr:DNA repair protein RecO [Tepidimonas alkaliphilus]TSE18698.1 DNA repair protein RecO [Tepidimonas alkaliphilus]